MKAKLSLRVRIMMFFGYEYLLNKRSNEVHWLRNHHPSCGIEKMAKHNKKWLTKKQFRQAFQDEDVDGCRWCLSWENKG